MRDSQQLTKIVSRVTTTWAHDFGLHLLENFQQSQPGEHGYVDLNKLATLPYQTVDDMDARGRGFLFYYRNGNTIVYRNIFAANLYAVGNLYTNCFIDVINDGTKTTHAWKRYRQPIRIHIRGDANDKRPVLDNINFQRKKGEVIPFTTEKVGKPRRLPPEDMHKPKCWTPIFIPCHSTECIPPPLLYKTGPAADQVAKKYFYGHKRKYTVSNEHIDQLIKHPTSHICTKTYNTFWKSCRDGPIPMYFCGNLLDDKSYFDLRKYQSTVLNKRRYSEYQSFITFSPIGGLCDFTKNQVRLSSEPIQRLSLIHI